MGSHIKWHRLPTITRRYWGRIPLKKSNLDGLQPFQNPGLRGCKCKRYLCAMTSLLSKRTQGLTTSFNRVNKKLLVPYFYNVSPEEELLFLPFSNKKIPQYPNVVLGQSTIFSCAVKMQKCCHLIGSGFPPRKQNWITK